MEAVPREQPEKASEWKWTRESGQVEEEHRLLPRTNVETVSILRTHTGTGWRCRLWAWSLQNLQRAARWSFSDASFVD